MPWWIVDLGGLRRVPEGGVYAVATTTAAAQELASQAVALSPLDRPIVLQSPLSQLTAALYQQAPHIAFDWILGRNALGAEIDKVAIVQQPQYDPHQLRTGHFSRTSPPARTTPLSMALQYRTPTCQPLASCEEAIYAPQTGDPLLNWQVEDWRQLFQAADFK